VAGQRNFDVRCRRNGRGARWLTCHAVAHADDVDVLVYPYDVLPDVLSDDPDHDDNYDHADDADYYDDVTDHADLAD
jgi:hypothetical protein